MNIGQLYFTGCTRVIHLSFLVDRVSLRNRKLNTIILQSDVLINNLQIVFGCGDDLINTRQSVTILGDTVQLLNSHESKPHGACLIDHFQGSSATPFDVG